MGNAEIAELDIVGLDNKGLDIDEPDSDRAIVTPKTAMPQNMGLLPGWPSDCNSQDGAVLSKKSTVNR